MLGRDGTRGDRKRLEACYLFTESPRKPRLPAHVCRVSDHVVRTGWVGCNHKHPKRLTTPPRISQPHFLFREAGRGSALPKETRPHHRGAI